jgi:hypothetical protein
MLPKLMVKSIVAGSVLALTVALSFASDAQANTAQWVSEPGYFGKPLFAGDASCFTESWGGVVNSCSSNKVWRMAVQQGNTDYTPAYVTTTNTSMTCYLNVCNYQYGTSCAVYAGTPDPGYFGIQLGPPSYYSTTYEFIDCIMPPNAEIAAYEWYVHTM